MKIELNKEEISALKDLVEDQKGKVWDDVYNELENALYVYEEAEYLMANNVDYELSENQKQFVIDVIANNLEVDFTYSGRGMMGRKCPSVKLDAFDSFSSNAKTSQDQLGLGKVIYASR